MTALLQHLLCTDPTALGPTLPDFWSATPALRDRFAHPLERALALGLVAPTVGAAFVSGYRAALHALVPSLGAHTRAALCATEDGGAHPKAIATTLSPHGAGLVLDGSKRFVTGARDADALLVLAREGTSSDDRPVLALVRVSPTAEGVAFTDMPETPFVPDVSHASVAFAHVALAPDARLAGDGWSAYVKPFRTVEDLHVQAAITAFLVGTLRRSGGPHGVIERLAAHALTLRALADGGADNPSVHVALAGCFANLDAALAALEPWWPSADDGLRAQWGRDRAILRVASKAREQRRQRAWERLGPPLG